MLKLLCCARGHFWETAEAERPSACPVCGTPADSLPLLAPCAPVEAAPAPAVLCRLERPSIPGIEILEDLGRGPGGAALYKARQTLAPRTVLLKVVIAAQDRGQRAWGCLRGEATALAKLAHPHIVQLYEAGERDRQFFYNVVELVDGPTLAQKWSAKQLPVRQAAVLVETLARAVQHAHDQGVVHRALQPAAVYLQPHKSEGRTDAVGPPFCLIHSMLCVPKITDFGLARRPVAGEVNDLDFQRGTPSYLAPEQVWGRVKEIGPATDVYALGAILYELACGVPPFAGETPADVLDSIQTREPVSPQKHRPCVPADLAAICLMCLHKQPRRRYRSALDLADDLRRFGEGQPVEARPLGRLGQCRRWARRRPALAGLLLVVLAAGALLTTAFRWSARHAEGAAVERAFSAGRAQGMMDAGLSRLDDKSAQARRNEQATQHYLQIALAERELAAGQPAAARALLDALPEGARHFEVHYLRRQAAGGAPMALSGLDAPPIALLFHPLGQALATLAAPREPDGTGSLRVWSAPLRERRAPEWVLHGAFRAFDFSPDGRWMATVAVDPRQGTNEVAVWTRGAGQLFAQAVPDRVLSAVRFTPDGNQVKVLAENGQVLTLHASTGIALPGPAFTPYSGIDKPRAALLAVGPAGVRVVSVAGAELFLHGEDGWARPVRLVGHTGAVTAVAFCRTSGNLVSGGRDGTARLWNLASGKPLLTLTAHAAGVTALAFSHDGQRLATGGEDGVVRLWDAVSGQQIATLADFAGGPSALAFAPDGRRLAVGHGTQVRLFGGAE